MIQRIAAVAFCLLPLAAAPALFGDRRSFAGIYTSHLEFSEFEGCWLAFAPSARERYRTIVPESFDRQRVRIEFVGRSTPRLRNFRQGSNGYGHMAMYPCQIEVIELKSARELPPAGR